MNVKLYPKIISFYQKGESDKKMGKPSAPPKDKKYKKAYLNGYYNRY